MKAIVLNKFGGYDMMKIKDVERPKASPNHVVVKMRACGINFSDLYVRQGVYVFHDIKPPFVLGQEGSGIIVEIGENVDQFKDGDRVMCWNFTYGLWAEYAEIPVNQCHLLPKAMTFQEAAAIPINYCTAYFSILDFGNLRTGQSILIQSAAGGVGWAATQLARTLDKITIFGTASSVKHSCIKENGVTHAIDYNTADFIEEVLRISPNGVNVVLDCLSGTDFTRSQKLLTDMGRLIHIGLNSAVDRETNWFRLLKWWWNTKDIKVQNLVEGNYAVCGLNLAKLHENKPATFKDALNHIVTLFEDGKIKPKIDSVWDLEEVEKAQQHMFERKNIGKIILTP